MEAVKGCTENLSSKKKKEAKENSISSPHDRLFKTAMSNIRVAQDFFEHYLPETVRSVVDLNHLELCQNSYVDQTLKLSLSDVLYKTTIADEPGYIYVLCEHQSSVDPLMPFRLWQYMVAIWQDHINQTGEKTLPLIIPLVFYHGVKPYSGPRDLRDLLNGPKHLIDEIFLKPFHLIDTHEIEDETLRQQQWIGIMAFAMKNIFIRDVMSFIHPFLDMIRSLEQQAGSTDYIVSLLKYLWIAGDIKQPKVLADTLEQELCQQARGDIMTYDEWVEGMILKKGQSYLLLHMLERKFGQISISYHERLDKANSEQLLIWAEKLMDANNPDMVFGE